ncbi:MAG: cytochrome c1 [Gammaproteobacteria bacterium HGW-Gammaproteobacteria-3]|nr:MAG: cytochrome c1 [Gammaproteobacteria bacterium HGW-Gammaproteobacteria-3]
MKNLLNTLLILMLPFGALAGGGIELQHADIDLADNASLQRGAKHFVNYCLGCHSAKQIRYLRIALDFDMEKEKVLSEIAPEGATIYDKMHSAMNAHDAEKWFGTMPPDLSLIGRSRGADWLYTYLKGFYTDKSRPYGVNNIVFQDVAMPNILWQQQGSQAPLYEKIDGKQVISRLVMEEPGQLSEAQFDKMVNDLVNFLVYVGEPVQLERQRMGKYVLFFIFMFLIIAYLLKREYWKDIH